MERSEIVIRVHAIVSFLSALYSVAVVLKSNL
jgi:hypothetical protein